VTRTEATTTFAPDFRVHPYWWEAAEPRPANNELPQEAEVAIVGGGYAGLSAALTLQRLGHAATVIDAGPIGWGASSRNGGMVSGGLKVASTSLTRRFGPDHARAIAATAVASFPFLEELLAREGIDCDYVRCGRFMPAWTKAHWRALAGRAEFLAELTGLPTRMVPRERQHEELASDHYHGGMVVEATGSLHPARYVRGLAQAAARAGVALVDGVRVQEIAHSGSGFTVRTASGTLRAAAVLVTTNGYSRTPDGDGALPWLTRRLVPVASYIIATEPLRAERVRALFPTMRMVADTKRVLNYFRPSPDGTRVLWGGRASFRSAPPEQAATVLARTMTDVFPQLRGVRLTHAWNGNVAFTFDGLPHVGVRDGIHYAAGCQGSGVAMASWLGHNAALRIAGAANEAFALADLPFPAAPLYDGRPWFLPVVGEWYRLRDRIDRALG
jgi:glycine/D-amino acid oxidase-like deaminating enzyme